MNLYEFQLSNNVKRLTMYEYIRQALSAQIEEAIRDGETSIIIDGIISDKIKSELIRIHSVTIETKTRFYLFKQTIIHLRKNSSNG